MAPHVLGTFKNGPRVHDRIAKTIHRDQFDSWCVLLCKILCLPSPEFTPGNAEEGDITTRRSSGRSSLGTPYERLESHVRAHEVVHCCSEPLKQSRWQGTEPKEGFYICERQRTSSKSREKKSRVLKCREDINGPEAIKVMFLRLTSDGQRREQQTFLPPILARVFND